MHDIPAGAKFRSFKKRHQAGSAANEGGSRRRRAADELPSTSGTGMSDMDRWLEQVFDQALDGTVVDTDDERALSSRIKGGGDNPRQPSTVRLTSSLYLFFITMLSFPHRRHFRRELSLHSFWKRIPRDRRKWTVFKC